MVMLLRVGSGNRVIQMDMESTIFAPIKVSMITTFLKMLYLNDNDNKQFIHFSIHV